MPAYDESGITARVSASLPSGPHMWPEVRIIAGIEASTITSDGTCRLVMPLSESTIARRGPVGDALLDRRLDLRALGQRLDAGEDAAEPVVRREARGSASASPYSAKTSGKKARTTWPKMIGSETFIIVALRCTENSTSSALARAICAVRNSRSAATASRCASTTSPASTGTDSLSTVVVAVVADQLDAQRVVGLDRPTDFSLERKSSALMCATLVFESALHAPIECGCLRA